jgi:hypothetical protein
LTFNFKLTKAAIARQLSIKNGRDVPSLPSPSREVTAWAAWAGEGPAENGWALFGAGARPHEAMPDDDS